MLGDNRKRLILIDDHILVRQGLERLLNLGDKFVVCEETGDAASGLELVRELRPDGVIVDACLHYGTDGIDLTKKLLEEFPAIVVLILSAHDDPEYIHRAAKAGAMGYVVKSACSTVRYEAVNAMLLNEFLKEHRKVQQLEANDAEQQSEIKALVATVKEQASQIQKVSAQLEVNKPAPQTVLNNQ